MSITLAGLAVDLPWARVVGDPHVPITGITYDSRAVRPGDLFVCIQGLAHDGHTFASEALKRGAVALVVQRELPVDAPQLVAEDTRYAMGRVAARFYGFPTRRLRLVGVTGTNGKTTTTYFIRSLLEQAGRKCGLIGTVEHDVGRGSVAGVRTTPESVEIQRLAQEAVANGCVAMAMEVSSHSLVLHRTVGSEFDVGVFTNLSHDHLDFHGSLEAYRNAKLQLFRELSSHRSTSETSAQHRYAVINADDPHATHFVRAASTPVITYGLRAQSDVRARDVQVEASGLAYTVESPKGEARVRLRMTGRFNVYNSLAAIAVGLEEGVEWEHLLAGIEQTVVPGRFEPVDVGQPFAVIVDYAHTPDGLENVLRTARTVCQGQVICVVGAGGDRDRAKRPAMGEVAARFSDFVYVTSDNPRSEDPETICAEVAEGVRRHGGAYEVVVDRREAIRQAIARARAQDLVLIAGKGHETYQEIGAQRVHFDDREEAKAALLAQGGAR